MSRLRLQRHPRNTRHSARLRITGSGGAIGRSAGGSSEISVIRNDGGQAPYVPEHKYMGDPPTTRKPVSVNLRDLYEELSGAFSAYNMADIREIDFLKAVLDATGVKYVDR